MGSLALATSFFVGIHLFVSGTTLRDRITAAIGEKAYLGLFSLASLLGIVWMCSAYASSPSVGTWGSLPGMWTFTAIVTMPIAFFLAVVGITTPSPTAMGAEGLLDSADPVKGILRITRHPFLWGGAIWSATHLIANGDLASLIFFGGFLALTLAGTRAIDGKRARKLGAKWEAFAASTSNVPFAAIASGRNRLAVGELLGWRLAAAAGAYAGMYIYHGALFG